MSRKSHNSVQISNKQSSSEDRNRRRVFAFTVLLIVVSASLVLLTLLQVPAVGQRELLIIDTLALAASVCLLVILRAGRTRLVAYTLLTLVYLASLVPSILIFETIRAPTMFGFYVIVPLAGLLVGRRSMLALFSLAIISTVVLYLFEANGILNSYLGTQTKADDLIMVLMGLSLNTVLFFAILSDVDKSADMARSFC